MASWVCPKCHRPFSREGQNHSCKPAVPVDTHFEGRPPALRKAYDALVKKLEKKTKCAAVGTAGGVHLVGKAAFGGIKVLKDVMRVEFLLPRPLKSERVFKSEKFSATRYAHHVEVHGPDDVDSELIEWLVEADATRS